MRPDHLAFKQPAGLGRAIILIARSAIAAVPIAEMERLRTLAAARGEGAWVAYAFTEQGAPSLREVVLGLLGEPITEILFVPLLLPMEPAFAAWLTRTLQHWRTEYPGPWPVLRIGAGIGQGSAIADLLSEQIATARGAVPVSQPQKTNLAGSLVPAQKRRVLVCQGGPCMAAGADVIWGHLRNEQARLVLREAGEGTMSAKTSCLGPCNLAPVLQVWPEGTVYGGVDEAGVDAIIAAHLLEGRIVTRLAYAPTGRKQILRQPQPAVDDAIDGLTDCRSPLQSSPITVLRGDPKLRGNPVRRLDADAGAAPATVSGEPLPTRPLAIWPGRSGRGL